MREQKRTPKLIFGASGMEHHMQKEMNIDAGLSQIRGTILGVPITRIAVFWGLYSGFLTWETTDT